MTVRLSIPQEQLRDIALQALQIAKDLGASAASCEASESSGLSVTTRKTVVETIENTRDKGIAITIYIGKRRGHSSTSDFAPAALREAVQAAYDIARFTAEDDAAGLPDEDTLERSPAELDLFHPWPIETDEAIGIAQRAEQAELRGRQRVRLGRALRAGQYARLCGWLSVLATFDLGSAHCARRQRNAARRLVFGVART